MAARGCLVYLPPASAMLSLPIDPVLPEICATLERASCVVLEAPPGAGKTTRVPRALFDAGFASGGEIVVLEPRRLAARLAARRVAEEMGEEVGKTVGYTMRFEDASSAATRIRFVTEGTLTRRLLTDRTLSGVSVVLLDEFHERHLDGDIALAMLRRLQKGARPDLKIAVMSATLDADKVAAYLDDAPRIQSQGRLFDVEIEHLAQSDDRPLESQVASAVRRIVNEEPEGDILVFLPGALEIRRAMDACGTIASRENLLVLPLHGSLSPIEQDRAVRPANRRKVILSTNVAETSVTIDGITCVIDSGLARVMTHSPWSGLPTLRLSKISRASATQRAGRAGRTRPGRCIRLYTKGDSLSRPEFESPEIARADLSETALELSSSGIVDLASFPWFEPPPPASLEAARVLLAWLGATEQEKGITPLGRRILRFPLHPRLGRMLVEAEKRGIAEDGCALAALVSERDIGAKGARSDARHRSDVLSLLELYEEAEAVDFAPDRLRYMGLSVERVRAVTRVQRQLRRLADKRAAPAPRSLDERETAQLISILAGYPDRVGRLRRPASATGRSAREIVFAGGGTGVLAEESGVADVDLVVAVDVEERNEPARAPTRGGRVLVRLASVVEADWLLDLFTDRIRDTTEHIWNEASGRVEVVRSLSYEGLVLEETRAQASASEPETARVLSEALRQKGWRALVGNEEELERFLLRLSFAREHCPELGLPLIDEAELEAHLPELCAGAVSLSELRERGLFDMIRARLSPEQAQKLAELAPETLTLPGGRRLKIEYTRGAPPKAASRLQDFFGMARGPVLAKGRVPLVLELLAPNHRAVQVTTDLAGFWERHYPAIAKELRRRYPKHKWPDDPLSATPPEPRGRR